MNCPWKNSECDEDKCRLWHRTKSDCIWYISMVGVDLMTDTTMADIAEQKAKKAAK